MLEKDNVWKKWSKCEKNIFLTKIENSGKDRAQRKLNEQIFENKKS